jgi:hypothetical protein
MKKLGRCRVDIGVGLRLAAASPATSESWRPPPSIAYAE